MNAVSERYININGQIGIAKHAQRIIELIKNGRQAKATGQSGHYALHTSHGSVSINWHTRVNR
ncbi:hypothetical protein E9531_16415 [Lampropedia puyangensis]|uniref:Uncharacterized protein n=1 Tax=Lampropedia puyangensis TaxID=1330072 RepID=A0A4S8ENX3_9BURK|nr:hypothetical protein E9531_16415 [Lampropedia puyangensis]